MLQHRSDPHHMPNDVDLRPWLHPKTGRFYYRRRVPKDLVKLEGRAEFKKSLKTTNEAEAVKAFAGVHKQIEQKWSELRRGNRDLTWNEIASIAGDMYDKYMKEFEESKFSIHYHGMFLSNYCDHIVKRDGDELARKQFRSTVGVEIDAYLVERGLIVDPSTRRTIDYHVAKAVRQAIGQAVKWMGGDHRPDPEADRFPRTAAIKPAVRLLEQFARYADESELSPATRKRWSPVFASLIEFAGHDDLARIDADMLVAWLEHLRAGQQGRRKPKAVTLRDVYLASIKAVYGWLVAQRRLTHNPALDLKVKVPSGQEREMREFSNAEACTILSAALSEQPADLPYHLRMARRWVPWICAYTGARVNEITQLRREDVFMQDGIWVVHITPEAGRVKDRRRRKIPLHPHLVKQKFLQFVQQSPEGPLFYVPDFALDADMSLEHLEARRSQLFRDVAEHLANWVRGLGITEKDVGPNHGWRHRFKTEGRRAGMKEQVLDNIQGHAPRTKGAKYGAFPPDVMLPQILKLVPYVVEGTTVTVAGATAIVYDYGSDDSEAAAEALQAERRAA